MAKKKTHTKERKGLSDAELIIKYDNGGKINFVKTLKKVSKSLSATSLSKQDKKGKK